MRIPAKGEDTHEFLKFASLVPQKKDAQLVKSFKSPDGKEEVKTSPDGRPVHRVNLQAFRLDRDGNIVDVDKTVGLALIVPVDIEAGVHYGLSGKVWITPYQTDNNRIAYSILAESVKPLGRANHSAE